MSEKNENKVDYKFLESPPYSEFSVDLKQLKGMFDDEIGLIREEELNLDEEEIIEEAQESLLLSLQKMNKGGSIMGKGANFGSTIPDDYVARWNKLTLWAYNELAKGEDEVKIFGKTFNSCKEMIKAGWIEVKETKNGKKIIARDHRNGKEGKELPESGYMGNFISVWRTNIDKKKMLVVTPIGGEINDSIVNPLCPTCKSKRDLNWEKECNKIIKNVECDGIKDDFLLPTITQNAGYLIDFPLRVETKDGKVEDVTWSRNIKESMLAGGKKLSIKRERKDGKIEITGTLMQWVPKERLLTSKKLMDVWFKDRIMKGKAATALWDKFGYDGVFYIGKIYQMGENEYYSKRDFWCSDETTKLNPKDDDGVRIKIPSHVYIHNVKNKFGLKSLCLFAGKLGRDVEKDKNKKTKMKKIEVTVDGKKKKVSVPIYQKPHIEASCVIPIVARKPVEEEDVGKIELQMGDGIVISDKKKEKSSEKTEDKEEKVDEKIPNVEITDEDEIKKVFDDGDNDESTDGWDVADE